MSSKGQESGGMVRRIRPIAVSALIGAMVCALVLFLMSVLMSVQSIPQFAIDPMASLALAAGGFAGGLCCAKIMRENGLVYGAMCGVVLTVVALLAGMALKDNGFGIPALFKTAIIMLSSMLGGVVGVNTKKKRRKK